MIVESFLTIGADFSPLNNRLWISFSQKIKFSLADSADLAYLYFVKTLIETKLLDKESV